MWKLFARRKYGNKVLLKKWDSWVTLKILRIKYGKIGIIWKSEFGKDIYKMGFEKTFSKSNKKKNQEYHMTQRWPCKPCSRVSGVGGKWTPESFCWTNSLLLWSASILTVPKLVTLTLFFIGIFLLASLLPPVMLMDFNSATKRYWAQTTKGDDISLNQASSIALPNRSISLSVTSHRLATITGEPADK